MFTKCWKCYIELFKQVLLLLLCYFLNKISDPVDTISLPGFSDSSELAYGACIYIKSIQRSGNFSVNLVTSKSKVTPMKKRYSIPRLTLIMHRQPGILTSPRKWKEKFKSSKINAFVTVCS